MLEVAILCLSLNVYHEARGEPLQGQVAVALVTMNRAGRKPSRVCPEVTKPYQFSWTIDLLDKVRGGYRLKKEGIPREREAWDRAVQIASMVIHGCVPDFTRGATHFHTPAVAPTWRLAMKQIVRIGNHIFYRDA